MPERDLNVIEERTVREWMRKQGSSWWHKLDDDITASGVYKVRSGRSRNGQDKFEPVAIHGRPVEDTRGAVYSIFCSQEIANQLEKAGVIRFSEDPKVGA